MRKNLESIKAFQNIFKNGARKKLLFLGTGAYSQYFLINTKLLPDIFLDNNPEKDGQELFGKRIFHPSKIKNWDNCFVIITVKKPDIIAAMEQQLQGYGHKKDEDYLIGPEYFLDPSY